MRNSGYLASCLVALALCGCTWSRSITATAAPALAPIQTAPGPAAADVRTITLGK